MVEKIVHQYSFMKEEVIERHDKMETKDAGKPTKNPSKKNLLKHESKRNVININF